MLTEAYLWSDFKTGSRAAYEQVIRDYYQDLYRYGLRLVDHPDFVKDCIHDLFVHIWERRSHLGETDDIRLYLLKSLRNRILKEISKESKLTGLSESIESAMPPISSREEEVMLCDTLLYTRKRVRNVLQELTPRQREIVHLRFFEGLSNERIAQIMNISKPAVANLVHGTLKTLRRIWHASKLVLAALFI